MVDGHDLVIVGAAMAVTGWLLLWGSPQMIIMWGIVLIMAGLVIQREAHRRVIKGRRWT